MISVGERVGLVVDDNPANKDFLTRLLKQTKMHILSAGTGEEALQQLTNVDDLFLAAVDMELPDTSGLKLTSVLREKYPNCYIVIATMHDHHSLMVSALNGGANCFLVKPHGFMELFQRVNGNKISQTDRIIIDQNGYREFKG